ncbi:hypothetical protein ACJRO7_024517 [Eucalyptus globulus]|uniref:non-specific serine/threonine protein kinase n=1 Tax=Eucalyptus globulus TaxID=34317 RepID=A0ABD3KB27_EUCGL
MARLEDHFSLGEKLGEGQFGTAYLCADKATHKIYACKSIPKRKLHSQEDVEEVRREIQIMHHLSEHPNVVQIKGTYEDSTSVHIVMELCGGGELFDRIIKKGRFSEREAANQIKMIVRAVEACHSAGVMHRDLKPENFLFVNPDDDAELKVIDFGLSVFFKPGQVFSDVVGSPYYVAPEVLLKHYGPEVDVWSAGVILYILLSGFPPFSAGRIHCKGLQILLFLVSIISSTSSTVDLKKTYAGTESEILREVLQGELDVESDPWTSISDSAKDLVKKMLDRDPRKRFSAKQVLCKLSHLHGPINLFRFAPFPFASLLAFGLGC